MEKVIEAIIIIFGFAVLGYAKYCWLTGESFFGYNKAPSGKLGALFVYVPMHQSSLLCLQADCDGRGR